MNYWQQSEKNIYVASHRGDSAYYPENTMEAFRAALAEGVDQIETDIRITKDGEPVIFHDATVGRTTDGAGLVKEKTLAEMKALDAGCKKGEKFKGCRVPTFLEFMDLVKDYPTLTLNLELKEYPTPGYEETAYSVADRVLKTVDDYGFTDRIVINSFSGKLMEYVHQKYGNRYRQHVFFPVSHMGKVEKDPYSYAYCCCMFPTYFASNMAEKWDFDRMRELGVQPWVGASVKDEATVDEAIRNGAVLITCNNPGDILEILRKKGYHQ